MPKSLKIALTLLGACYFFSLGIWAARGLELYKNHQNLKSQIKTLNEISQEHKSNLLVLAEKLKEQDQSLSKHIISMAQLTPEYTLENTLLKMEEQSRLDSFSENVLNYIISQIPNYPPKETIAYQELFKKVKKQRAEVKQALFIP